MNADERDKLLDLHRATMKAEADFWSHEGDVTAALEADDAFRAYLMSLDVTE